MNEPLILNLDSLSQAQVLTNGEVLPRVVPGVIVTFQADDGEVFRLQLVEAERCPASPVDLSQEIEIELPLPEEPKVDVLKGRISDASPVGKALLGCRAGDRIEVVLEWAHLGYTLLEVSSELPLPDWAARRELALS